MATGDVTCSPPAYSDKSQVVWVAMTDFGSEQQQHSLYPVQHVLLPQQHLPEHQNPLLQQYGPLQQSGPSGRTTPVVAPVSRPLMEDQEEVQSNVTTYMGLSLFTALCCCLPVGAWAIAKSRQVEDANSSGDFERAKKNSDAALCINMFSMFLGVIGWVLLIIRFVVLGNSGY
ncbi:uncharacterized protein LOC144865415 [Branchiostoma floridae x Branchiostoma japonicum]